MASIRTTLGQAPQPEVSPVEQYLAGAPAHLNTLRLKQEHARMAFVSAMKDLRATPKDRPEYEHKRFVFREAKTRYEQAKLACIQAENMIDLVRRSEAQRLEDARAEEAAHAAVDQAIWAKSVREAQAPFEFVANRKGGRLRPARGTVRAPCGVVCMDEQAMVYHRISCPACQGAVSQSSLPEIIEL